MGATEFLGYDTERAEGAVVALVRDGQEVQDAPAGSEVSIVLNQTPFYAESGGQVGDQGVLESITGGSVMRFKVADTQKIQSEVFGHHGTLEAGTLAVGDVVQAKVDAVARERTRNHHVPAFGERRRRRDHCEARHQRINTGFTRTPRKRVS